MWRDGQGRLRDGGAAGAGAGAENNNANNVANPNVNLNNNMHNRNNVDDLPERLRFATGEDK